MSAPTASGDLVDRIIEAYRAGLSIHSGTFHIAKALGYEINDADTLDYVESAARLARRRLNRSEVAAITEVAVPSLEAS